MGEFVKTPPKNPRKKTSGGFSGEGKKKKESETCAVEPAGGRILGRGSSAQDISRGRKKKHKLTKMETATTKKDREEKEKFIKKGNDKKR